MTSDAARSLERKPHPDYFGRLAEVEARPAFTPKIREVELDILAKYAHLSDAELDAVRAAERLERDAKRQQASAAATQDTLVGGVTRVAWNREPKALIPERIWTFYGKRTLPIRVYSHLRAVYGMREDRWTQQIDQAKLAGDIGYSRERVSKALTTLETDRWIASDGSAGKVSRYRAVEENL